MGGVAGIWRAGRETGAILAGADEVAGAGASSPCTRDFADALSMMVDPTNSFSSAQILVGTFFFARISAYGLIV
jgi:hypothetical protein